MSKPAECEKLLRSMVTDIEAMRRSGQHWFGPFPDSTEDGLVYWPNLGILSDQASELLNRKRDELGPDVNRPEMK